MRRKIHLPRLLLLLLVLCAGCTSLDGILAKARPKARLTGVHFGQPKSDSLELLFDMQIKNPYPVALPLTGLDYSLTSGEKQFVTGSAKPETTIPAGSEQEVTLPVKVDYRQILQTLKGIRPGSTIPYKAQLMLAADTQTFGKLDLPLKKQGEITLPTVSSALKDLWDLVTK